MKEKEIKNARLAMVAFVGFVIQAQATGKGPLANIADHVSNPFAQNITKNIGNCMIPESVDIQASAATQGRRLLWGPAVSWSEGGGGSLYDEASPW